MYLKINVAEEEIKFQATVETTVLKFCCFSYSHMSHQSWIRTNYVDRQPLIPFHYNNKTLVNSTLIAPEALWQKHWSTCMEWKCLCRWQMGQMTVNSPTNLWWNGWRSRENFVSWFLTFCGRFFSFVVLFRGFKGLRRPRAKVLFTIVCCCSIFGILT